MADHPFKAANFGTVTKDRRTFPALSDAERAAILATRKVTICPPVRIATTFTQQLAQRRFG